MPSTRIRATARRPGPGRRRALAAGAALAVTAGLIGTGSPSTFAAPGDRDAALTITVPQALPTPLAPGSAPAHPGRAFFAAGSVAALQARSLQLILAHDKAAKEKAAKEKASKEKARKKAAQKRAAKAVSSARGSQTASRSKARRGSPRAVGRALASERGWGGAQFACLDKLWTKESNWTTAADNPTSSAYGIPQALPGSKMSSHGPNWRTNAATQIRWGLDYIDDRYGSPCSAWAHSRANNWY